jgi:hypothetical protein
MEIKRENKRHPLPESARRRDKSGHGKKAGGRGTHILESADRLVRAPKQRERTRGTHSLKGAERGTGQDTEAERARERGDSLSGAHRGRDKSGIQDTQRRQDSEGYSLSGERRGKGQSWHGKRASEQAGEAGSLP